MAERLTNVVEGITKSKSGKSYRVMLMGKWYGCNKDEGLDESSKGAKIEYRIEDTDDFGLYIREVKVIVSAMTAATTPSGKGDYMYPADRWWLSFVSNQVAHGQASGLITDKATLNQWAKNYKECILALDALNGEPGSDG